MSTVETEKREHCDPVVKQAQELFRQLDLDDPAVQRYYQMLERLNRMQQEPSAIWLRTNIHSVAPFERY